MQTWQLVSTGILELLVRHLLLLVLLVSELASAPATSKAPESY